MRKFLILVDEKIVAEVEGENEDFVLEDHVDVIAREDYDFDVDEDVGKEQ